MREYLSSGISQMDVDFVIRDVSSSSPELALHMRRAPV
jgi:hypothetical protein